SRSRGPHSAVDGAPGRHDGLQAGSWCRGAGGATMIAGKGKREKGKVCSWCALLFPFPFSLLFLAAIGCTAITVRPTYRPFPLAAFDTVTAKPPDVLSAAGEEVKRLGLSVRVMTPAEG